MEKRKFLVGEGVGEVSHPRSVGKRGWKSLWELSSPRLKIDLRQAKGKSERKKK